ncbi:gag-protease polyprotein [Cucumis melo var. makuwa]|uniref:Gag-protease polyprotein n=1 Tax=Cucumis melo var. makuwa TaxID=1194695 RepID=A0A5A7SVU7_CUCMM|nr:gag-protease polyprotein [Cucumis melo var. makuwa]
MMDDSDLAALLAMVEKRKKTREEKNKLKEKEQEHKEREEKGRKEKKSRKNERRKEEERKKERKKRKRRNGKAKRTPSEDIYEKFEKKLEELSPLEDEVVKPSKTKSKVTIKKQVLREQFAKKREENEKRGPRNEEVQEEKKGDQEGETEELSPQVTTFNHSSLSKLYKFAPQFVPDQLSAEAKHLRDFRKYNPTTFDGSLEDPTRAQMWLSSLETIFRYMKCPEDQKVQCAVFMLTDRGTAWWETTERMLGGDVSQITWQQFKESFYAKFFSASLRDAMRQEFLNLEQGDMTVEQYDAEFDMLSRFAPEMIATEAARADKFVRGLRLDIQGRGTARGRPTRGRKDA